MSSLMIQTFILLSSVTLSGGELDRVAKVVADQIKAEPGDIASTYSSAVLQQVTEVRLKALYGTFYAQHGKVVSVAPAKRDSDLSGKFTFAFEKGVTMKVTLSISTDRPAKVTGIFFAPPQQAYKGIEAALSDLKELPGTVSFQLAQLNDSGMDVLHSINPETSLGIGSTFKLYILAAMMEEGVSWNKVIKLDDDYKSLPSGRFHEWPTGSPMTLHTLATAMISESDNTATDHLLHEVGRKKVESMLSKTGNRNVDRNKPFLSTLEMFKLKSDTKLLEKYVKGDEDDRRKLLRGRVKRQKREGLAPFADGTPMAIDQVEWFASASDLCRLMQWIKANDKGTALPLISVNKGLDVSDEFYEYAGYKGGSEPGVLNMTWLLTTKSGKSYALSVGWNNPADEGATLETMIGIIQPVLDMIGRGEVG